jgi:hypothetical protein
VEYAEAISRNKFAEEPLDSRDRKLIQTICREGQKGIGFNKLVAKAKPFASRSTIAMRIGRLGRLGYLERIPSAGAGREKPVRVTFKCFSLMLTLDKSREVAADLDSKIRSMREAKSIGKEELKRWNTEFKERYNSLFGLVGTIAVFYGTSAAGDLFLPLIVEDYKNLFAKFVSLLRERPALLNSLKEIIGDEKASKGIDLDAVRKETRDQLLNPALYRFRDWGEIEESP